MIMGKQVRLQRSVIIEALPISAEVDSHTPPAIVAKMKEFNGQAIPVSMMTGIEAMTSTIKIGGSVAATKMVCGKGYTQLIDIIVTDIGTIGNNGIPYAHTYIYAAKVKSITPDTTDEGGEGASIELSVHAYEFKFDGKTIDEIDSRTGKIMIGGHTIVEAVF